MSFEGKVDRVKHKVFITYVGETSYNVAVELKKALEYASNGQIIGFLSDKEIHLGEKWSDRINKELDDCSLFIFCLTKENSISSWIAYEAGIARARGKLIIPLLINCEFEDLRSSPLGIYQGIKLFDDHSKNNLAFSIANYFNLDKKDKTSFTSIFYEQLHKFREKSGNKKYDYYISSLEEYIQVISSIDIDTDKKLSKNVSNRQANIFYRGQTSREKQFKGETLFYDPMPSVFRGKTKYGEQKIYNQIMTECAHEFSDCNSHCETLAKMQHYGTPTRLLDITTNALAALFFACVDDSGKTNNNSKGVVFVVQSDDKHIKVFDSDTITILSSLPRFSSNDMKSIKSWALEALNEGSDPYDYFHRDGINRAVLRLLHEVRKEKPAFEPRINPQDVLSNFIFTPQKTNARIVRQSGAFVIFGLGTTKLPCNGINAQFEGEPKVIAEIHISKKEDIKRALERCGISLATMYPELYKVSQYVSENVLEY